MATTTTTATTSASNSATTVYSRDSFDRFGDDLNQWLLSYTTFDDCFRLESVSKQWRRSLTQLVTALDIGYEWSRVYSTDTIATILGKCPAVSAVDINIRIGQSGYSMDNMLGYSRRPSPLLLLLNKESVFRALIAGRPKLTQIEADFCGLCGETLDTFVTAFGPTLERIKFRNDCPENQSVLIGCPNVRALDLYQCEDLSVVFASGDGRCLATKLADINFIYRSCDSERIGRLWQTNARTLQTVWLTDHSLIGSRLRFESLTALDRLERLVVSHTCIDALRVEHIRQIGLKCRRLSSLAFNGGSDSRLTSQRLYDAMDSFRGLRSLKIAVRLINQSPETTAAVAAAEHCMRQTLRHCRLLRRLSVWAKGLSLTDQYFADIGRHVPRLRCLDCRDVRLTDRVFEGLSSAPDLRSINFFGGFGESGEPVTDAAVVELIRRCTKLESIDCRGDHRKIVLNAGRIERIRHALAAGVAVDGIQIND